MAQVRLAAAPLNGGVSTQPPSNRFITQTTSSDNTLLALNRGLEKRYGSTFVSSGDTATGNLDYDGDPSNAIVHWVQRDGENIYCLVIDKTQTDTANVIQAFDKAGTKLTVTTKAGDEAAMSYIRAGSGLSRDELRVSSYADTTFITNRTVVTKLTGEELSYTMAGTDNPATDLDYSRASTQLNQIVNLITSDVGYPVGFYEYIKAGIGSGGAGATAEIGPWYEAVRTPYADSEVDSTSMPVRIVYTPSTQSLELQLCPWDSRLSGNADTNPGPSFIGQTLDDLTIFEDRMWLSAGQQVVSSQAGDLYNFWIRDWTTVVDSDPIDITLSGSSVNSGEFLIPFNRTLVIISEGSQQWEIQTLSAFTPADVNKVPTTNYDIDSKTVPAKIGNQLYFMSDQGKYSHMWEYFPNFDSDSNVGDNISSHVEGYLPNNVRRMSVSENNNMVFLWSEEEKNSLYVYHTSWQVSEKLQSAWCRWVLDSTVTILSHEVVDNDLYVILYNGTDLWMEYIPLTPPENTTDGSATGGEWDILTEDSDELVSEGADGIILSSATSDGVGFHANIDRKIVLTGVYSAATQQTTWTLPFEDNNVDKVVLGEQWGVRTGQVIASTTSTTGGVTTVVVSGDFSTYPAILGKTYTMSVQLSPPFVKDEQQMVVQGTLGIRTMDIMYEDSAFFEVTVKPEGRPTKTRRFISNRFGSAVFGQQNIEEFGRYRLQVRGNASDTVITLVNDSPFPSLFVNLEYQGNFVQSRNNPTKR